MKNEWVINFKLEEKTIESQCSSVIPNNGDGVKIGGVVYKVTGVTLNYNVNPQTADVSVKEIDPYWG